MSIPDWAVDFLSDVSALQALAWILGGILAIIAIVKLWPFVRNAVAIVDALVQLPTFIKRTDATLEAHTRQLENSHNTNLRDDITEAVSLAREARDGVEGVHGRLDGLQRSVDELATADDEIWAEIDRTQPPEE